MISIDFLFKSLNKCNAMMTILGTRISGMVANGIRNFPRDFIRVALSAWNNSRGNFPREEFSASDLSA